MKSNNWKGNSAQILSKFSTSSFYNDDNFALFPHRAVAKYEAIMWFCSFVSCDVLSLAEVKNTIVHFEAYI